MSIRGVEASQLGAQPHRGRRLLDCVRGRELEAAGDEPDAVAGIDRGLQAPERLLLVGFELTQALRGVKGCGRT